MREGRAALCGRRRLAPLSFSLNPAHEHVGDPNRVEQVTSPVLLAPVVLPQLQEHLNVSVPRLKVDGERAGPLATTLVNIPAE